MKNQQRADRREFYSEAIRKEREAMGAKQYDALKDKEILLSKNSTTEKGILSMPDDINKMRK